MNWRNIMKKTPQTILLLTLAACLYFPNTGFAGCIEIKDNQYECTNWESAQKTPPGSYVHAYQQWWVKDNNGKFHPMTNPPSSSSSEIEEG